MKVSILSIVALIIVSLNVAQAQVNGDFEEVEAKVYKGWTKGWQLNVWGGAKARFSVDKKAKETGKQGLLVEVASDITDNPRKVCVSNWQNERSVIDVKKGQTIKVSFFAKATSEGEMTVDIRTFKKMKNLKTKKVQLGKKMQEYSFDYVAKADGKYGLHIGLASGKGTYALDNVRMELF